MDESRYGGIRFGTYNMRVSSIYPDPMLCGILRTLRRTLNACAEPSGLEALTANVIANFVGAYTPDALLTGIGGHGVAAVYSGSWPGPTVLVRAELDALAFDEQPATVTHTGGPRSAHRCGHDGHMAIVAGLAPLLAHRRPHRGRVVLLFQPAEETGEGALRILNDPQFEVIRPDYALALHNIPGHRLNQVVLRAGAFASASVGMRIHLCGVAAHAAEPEKARTPGRVMCALIDEFSRLSDLENVPYRLLTVTHARMGRESFGITPGQATLCATLRSASAPALATLRREVESIVRSRSGAENLSVEIAWVDEFPETRNDDDLVQLLHEVCRHEHIEATEIERPFRWSEDFGHFGRVCPTLYFGLGIGEDAPRLHQPDYRFPDDVIQTGLVAFSGVVRKLTRAVADGEKSLRTA